MHVVVNAFEGLALVGAAVDADRVARFCSTPDKDGFVIGAFFCLADTHGNRCRCAFAAVPALAAIFGVGEAVFGKSLGLPDLCLVHRNPQVAFFFRDGADEACAIIVFSSTFVLQAGILSDKVLAGVGRLVEGAHGIHDVECFRVNRVGHNAGVLRLRAGFDSGPSGTVIVGTVDGCTLVGAVENHLAVSRKHDEALFSLKFGFQGIPSGSQVVGTVHYEEVLGFVGVVLGDGSGTQQGSAQRGVAHALRGADYRRMARCAFVDVLVGSTVVVTDSGNQRTVRDTDDV